MRKIKVRQRRFHYVSTYEERMVKGVRWAYNPNAKVNNLLQKYSSIEYAIGHEAPTTK